MDKKVEEPVVSKKPTYATHEEAKAAFKELLRDKVKDLLIIKDKVKGLLKAGKGWYISGKG